MPKQKRDPSVDNPPTVRLKKSSYQPSKAELDEEIQIDGHARRNCKGVGSQGEYQVGRLGVAH